MLERFAAVLLLVPAAACRPGHLEPQAAPSAPARTVRIAAVETVAESGAFVPATVVARSRAVLAARAMAAVTALPFHEGDRFPVGAILVQLDDRALRAAYASAAADAAAAEADLHRTESLLAKGAATPREDEQVRARAEGARSAVLAAREALAYAELRAPFAGTVASRPVHVGDVVSPGAPLLEIEGAEGLELQATLDGAEAAALRPGMTVEAVVDGIAESIRATVRSVSAAGDPGTHRFELRAVLPSTSGARSGLFARLLLPAAAPGKATRLVVPSASVFVRGGLAGVYVVAEGRARLRWVAVGETVGDRTEVRAGLAAGERVAADPAGLEDGALVVEATP